MTTDPSQSSEAASSDPAATNPAAKSGVTDGILARPNRAASQAAAIVGGHAPLLAANSNYDGSSPDQNKAAAKIGPAGFGATASGPDLARLPDFSSKNQVTQQGVRESAPMGQGQGVQSSPQAAEQEASAPQPEPDKDNTYILMPQPQNRRDFPREKGKDDRPLRRDLEIGIELVAALGVGGLWFKRRQIFYILGLRKNAG